MTEVKEWKILERRFKAEFEVVLKEHDNPDLPVPRFRVEIINGPKAEGQAFDKLNEAVLAYDELLVEMGIIDTVVLPPETAEECYATWQMRIRQTRGIEALGDIEDQMLADPQVKEFASEILERCGVNRAVSATIMRRVCETLLAEVRQQELAAVRQVAGFGRFG